MTRPPPTSTLFPYTTLFRSLEEPPVVDFKPASPGTKIIVRLRPGGSKIDVAAVIRQFAMNVDAPITVVKGAEKVRSEEHTSELQSHVNLVCRLLLEKKKKK